MAELRFAVNLLWVRPGKVGGTEVVIRHVLDGWVALTDPFHAVLITSEDNAETFRHYTEDERFELLTAPIRSEGILKRILWQNLHLASFLRKKSLRFCFSPVYDRPYFDGGIRYITTIHDIQAYHYPQYHPFHEVVYSKLIWHADKRRSLVNICISNYVKKDIEEVYHFDPERLSVIYDPVTLDPSEGVPFETLRERYGIEEGQYYYTLSQMIPHKNLRTLLKVFAAIRERREELPGRLLISGINGNATEEILTLIREHRLEEQITLTGYVSDAERNTLCRCSRAFLFPSVFEGFGIPPIEAMILHVPVITTRCTCIPEVTQELANYVSDPYDIDEWIRVMHNPSNRADELDLARYDRDTIAREYLRVILSHPTCNAKYRAEISADHKI